MLEQLSDQAWGKLRSWKRPVDPWREEPTLVWVFCQDLWPHCSSCSWGTAPCEGLHAGAARAELKPMGRTHFGEVPGGLSPMGGTHGGAGEGILSLRRNWNMRWTDCNPHFASPCNAAGEDVQIRKEWGEGVFKVCFTSHCPDLILKDVWGNLERVSPHTPCLCICFWG